jgi:DNA invertase Pin-like site-specific DNA recombinase
MPAAKDPRVAIYCRVSTASQSVDPQESALQEYAVRRDWTQLRVFKDHAISGATDRRPALDQLMQECRRGLIDVVLVWKFDRFGRSMRHLIDVLEEFRQLKIDFISLTEAVDTSTPAGRMFFSIVAVMANFERELIAERVRLGLAEARRNGRRLGRPPINTLNEEKTRALLKERAESHASLRALARKYRVSLWHVHSLCKTAKSALRETTVSKPSKAPNASH